MTGQTGHFAGGSYRIAHLFADTGIEDEVLHTFGEVVRVGIDPEPNPFSTFIQADARDPPLSEDFDLAIAHPKCQRFSKATAGGGSDPEDHPNQIPEAREACQRLADHYIVENVPQAPLHDPVTFTGGMFGMAIHYPRAFETSFYIPQPTRTPRFRPEHGPLAEQGKDGQAWIGTNQGWRLAKGYSYHWPARGLKRHAVPAPYLRRLLYWWLTAGDHDWSGPRTEQTRLATDGGRRSDGTEHAALCSGGMDSVVSTHIAVRWGPADVVVHLDTGTGIGDNEEYIRDLGRKLGVQCWTLSTQNDYEEMVREHGFPGPSRHSIYYRKLKERQIQKLAAKVGGDLHCWTGVRAFESQRRMRHVEAANEHDAGRWYWRAPIHDWTKEDCREYLDRFDLPRNPLWDTLGRSGDCWCGCFGNPEELLDAEAAGQGDHADWLRDLEREVDTGDETERWAWGALSEHERRAERVDDDQMTLCSICGVNYPIADAGETTDKTTTEIERPGGG